MTHGQSLGQPLCGTTFSALTIALISTQGRELLELRYDLSLPTTNKFQQFLITLHVFSDFATMPLNTTPTHRTLDLLPWSVAFMADLQPTLPPFNAAVQAWPQFCWRPKTRCTADLDEAIGKHVAKRCSWSNHIARSYQTPSRTMV